MSEWQPIDTAPKDGTRIILCMGILGAVFGSWDTQKYHSRPKPYWTCDKEASLGVGSMRNNPPSHWMPQPEPPKA